MLLLPALAQAQQGGSGPSTRPAPGGGSGGGSGGRPPGGGGGGGGNRPPGGGGARAPGGGGGGRPPNYHPGGGYYYNGRYRPPYHGGYYAYPAGYGYRRWTYGQTLPLIFLSPTYLFTNYLALGIDAAPYGYVWVRYGPDLLLVDQRTGRIADIVYGAVY